MKIPFNQDQLNLLNTIGFDFDMLGELDDDQLFEIIDKTSEYLQLYGIADNKLNNIGSDCRELLDWLGWIT